MKRILLVGIAFVTASCVRDDTPDIDLFARTSAAKNEAEIASLRRDLEAARLHMKSLQTAHSMATLDPTDDKYTVVNTNLLPMLLIVDQLEPVADGSRLTLLVGNMHSATFSGGSMQVHYGPRVGSNASPDAIANWNKNFKTAETSFATALLPGRWTRVQIALPGTKPDAIGELSVSVTLDRVILGQTLL